MHAPERLFISLLSSVFDSLLLLCRPYLSSNFQLLAMTSCDVDGSRLSVFPLLQWPNKSAAVAWLVFEVCRWHREDSRAFPLSR